MKRVEREEKSEKIILLRDNLDDILVMYDMNITAKGEIILKKLANDERLIKYKNFLINSGNISIDNSDFCKRFGTLHDLFYDLISEKISLKKAATEQNQMKKIILELRNFGLLEEKEKTEGAININNAIVL